MVPARRVRVELSPESEPDGVEPEWLYYGVAAGGRGFELLEAGLEPGLGAGDVLQEVGLAGELDDEGLVAAGDGVVEEGEAGGALFVNRVALAEADIDQKTEGEGEIGVEIEIADGLGFTVDLEGEVVLGEILDEGTFFIVNYDGDVDQARIDVEGGSGGSRGLLGGGCCRCLSGSSGWLRQQRRSIGCS